MSLIRGEMRPLLACLPLASALSNGVGSLPAMGYNTWNDLRCDDVTAPAIRAIADSMLSLGLPEIGYTYLNVDDCWASDTGPEGVLVEDPKVFPPGDRSASPLSQLHAEACEFMKIITAAALPLPPSHPSCPSLLPLSPAFLSFPPSFLSLPPFSSSLCLARCSPP